MSDNEQDLLKAFKSGDKDAANELIGKYFDRVVGAAKKRLDGMSVRATSEDDVAASVFESLWKKAEKNHFSEDDLATPEELWRLLCTMVRFKARDHSRREQAQRRGGGKLRGESIFQNAHEDNAGIANFAIDAQSLSEDAVFREQHQQMMQKLGDDQLREVVTLRLEGYKVKEIAEKFDKSERWVKRKLALIRELWAEEEAAGAE